MTAAISTVAFTAMKDGTAEDYALLARLEEDFVAGTAGRILDHLRRLESGIAGYRVSRLEHSLQCATRAWRDGADIDWVVAALLHDIGDDLAPLNHDSLAAAVIRPYVREEVSWVVQHHGIFQMVYYAHHTGGDPNARDKYRGHPCWDAAVTFCERWDQPAFDPAYDTEPLDFFAPMVREVFARRAWDAAHLRPGAREPLVRERADGG
jgi:predicted HD phosphohydrolase